MTAPEDYCFMSSTGCAHARNRKALTLDRAGPARDRRKGIRHAGYRIELVSEPGDPVGTDRLEITADGMELELLPTKGLSVGEVSFEGVPLFWDPPRATLPDPDTLDLMAPMLIGGEEIVGFRFVEAFLGGLEMMGLRNWGMPMQDTATGALLPIHGEVANIPIRKLRIIASDAGIEINGSFLARYGKGGGRAPWHRRGTPVFEVTKRVIVKRGRPRITVLDHIANVSPRTETPDWGYHMQLRPRPGARFLVPSREARERAGKKLPINHDRWDPAKKKATRVERGIVHRGLRRTRAALEGEPGTRCLLLYPDGSGIGVTVPPCPYFLSWFSCGGKGSTEFMLPGPKRQARIMKRDWNGVGPEIGSSALDHDGDVDPRVKTPTLKPGETMAIRLAIERLDAKPAARLARSILQFNQKR